MNYGVLFLCSRMYSLVRKILFAFIIPLMLFLMTLWYFFGLSQFYKYLENISVVGAGDHQERSLYIKGQFFGTFDNNVKGGIVAFRNPNIVVIWTNNLISYFLINKSTIFEIVRNCNVEKFATQKGLMIERINSKSFNEWSKDAVVGSHVYVYGPSKAPTRIVYNEDIKLNGYVPFFCHD